MIFITHGYLLYKRVRAGKLALHKVIHERHKVLLSTKSEKRKQNMYFQYRAFAINRFLSPLLLRLNNFQKRNLLGKVGQALNGLGNEREVPLTFVLRKFGAQPEQTGTQNGRTQKAQENGSADDGARHVSALFQPLAAFAHQRK